MGELYDVVADPDETTNLYDDAEHQGLVIEGRRRLLDWLTRTTRSTTFMGRVGEDLAGDGRAARDRQPRFDRDRLHPNDV